MKFKLIYRYLPSLWGVGGAEFYEIYAQVEDRDEVRVELSNRTLTCIFLHLKCPAMTLSRTD